MQESQPLTQDDINRIITEQRSTLRTQVRESITFKLRRTIPDYDLDDLLSEAVVELLTRHHRGLLTFWEERKVIGYILFSCWCNYRFQNSRKRKAKVYGPDEDWLQEGNHRLFDLSEDTRSKQNLRVSLDDYLESNPEFAAEEPRSETDQDLSDTYYSQLFNNFFTYLDDCIQDGLFRTEEVQLYSQHILDGKTMKELVAESKYSQTFVYTAIRKIKNHLKTVDWRIKPQP